MRNTLTRVGVVAIALTCLFLMWTGTHQAGDEPNASGNDKAISDSLRKVINTGADLFNKNSDVNGCYQLYYGALIAVRPVLKADLQKTVDEGLAKAKAQPSLRQRAFTLNKTLQDIRTELGGGKAEPLPLPKPDVKKDGKGKDKPKKDGKGKDKPKKDGKGKDKPKKDGEKTAPPIKDKSTPPVKVGVVSGKVQFDNEVVKNAVITFAGVIDRSTKIGADGTYAFKKGLPVGNYVVYFESANAKNKVQVPVRYTNPSTSALRVNVKEGANTQNFELK